MGQVKQLMIEGMEMCVLALGRPVAEESDSHLVITQDALAEFHELTRQMRRRNALRKEILAWLAMGIPVEPGPLTARQITSESKRFSFARLVPLLGKATVKALKAQLSPTVSRRLVVAEDSHRATQGWANVEPIG